MEVKSYHIGYVKNRSTQESTMSPYLIFIFRELDIEILGMKGFTQSKSYPQKQYQLQPNYINRIFGTIKLKFDKQTLVLKTTKSSHFFTILLNSKIWPQTSSFLSVQVSSYLIFTFSWLTLTAETFLISLKVFNGSSLENF